MNKEKGIINKQVSLILGVHDTIEYSSFDDEDGIMKNKEFTIKLLPNISIEHDSKVADGKGYKYANTRITIFRLEWLCWSLTFTKKSKVR